MLKVKVPIIFSAQWASKFMQKLPRRQEGGMTHSHAVRPVLQQDSGPSLSWGAVHLQIHYIDLQTARNQVLWNKAYQGLNMLPADLYSFILGIPSCHLYSSIVHAGGCC